MSRMRVKSNYFVVGNSEVKNYKGKEGEIVKVEKAKNRVVLSIQGKEIPFLIKALESTEDTSIWKKIINGGRKLI